jgi:hypothetical protein
MTLVITTPPIIPELFPPVATDSFYNEPPDRNLLALLTFPDPPYLVTNPSNTINNVGNLRSLLPQTWFPDDDQILDAILATFAESLATIQARNDWIYQQDRIKTANGIWLDMFAEEFFGAGGNPQGNISSGDLTLGGWMYRRPNEFDAAYRSRILFELMAQRITRKGLYDMLTFWCGGFTPTIIEPWNPNDTGCWDGVGGIAYYDRAGYWGSNDDPWTTFIITQRNGGIPVQQFNDETPAQFLTHTPGIIGTNLVTNTNYLYGGYDSGLLFYIDGPINESQVSDLELYGVINRTIPEGTKAFVHLNDSQQLPNDPLTRVLELFNYNFILDTSELASDTVAISFINQPLGYVNSYMDLNLILDESLIALEPGASSESQPIPDPLPGFADVSFISNVSAAL